MKVRATFLHVIAATRDIEVDPEALAEWRTRMENKGMMPTDEQVLVDMLDNDEELVGQTFPDWRTSGPLPDDFEFQYTDVTEAVVVP